MLKALTALFLYISSLHPNLLTTRQHITVKVLSGDSLDALKRLKSVKYNRKNDLYMSEPPGSIYALPYHSWSMVGDNLF